MSARTSDALHVRAQNSAVQSLRERGVTWVSFNPMPDLACGIDFTLRKLPDLGLLSGTVQGLRHEHARRDSGDGDDDFSFHMNLNGLSFVSGALGEMTLGDGDAMLLSYSASRTISRPGLVDHRVIRLPRASLSPLVDNIDDAVLCRIPRGTGMLRLLRNYVDAVFDDPALALPEMRPLIVAQLCDLIAVTLGATRDAAAIAEGRGIRAARLRAIKSDIEAHLTYGDLSPGVVARRQGVSDSYIRKLFAGEGTSFSQFVLNRRLVRAQRMLTDRRWADRSVAWIAFETGFGDLSYFNRTFKRFYGNTPSEIRGAVIASS
ncbi:MAG TPA: helix-turn-helix domain-containing protein [Candidatus Baltobacteraceae bacterium]|nr:helix-turn-helix domain-containing protein [Candidatus Baltobacteraceae bacterium]